MLFVRTKPRTCLSVGYDILWRLNPTMLDVAKHLGDGLAKVLGTKRAFKTMIICLEVHYRFLWSKLPNDYGVIVPEDRQCGPRTWRFVCESKNGEPMMVPYNPITCRPIRSRTHLDIFTQTIQNLPYGHPVGIPEEIEVDEEGFDAREWLIGPKRLRSDNASISESDKGDPWPEMHRKFWPAHPESGKLVDSVGY